MKLKGNVVSDALTGERIYLRRGIDLQVCYSQGKSPAIVFLHGGLGNRFNWRSLLRVLPVWG